VADPDRPLRSVIAGMRFSLKSRRHKSARACPL